MTRSTRIACAQCGYANESDALACSMCGRVVRHESESPAAPHRPPPRTLLEDPATPQSIVVSSAREERILGLPEPVFFLLAGLLAAPIFSVTPILGFMGWFFESLVHEMGHSVVGWLFGCPAFPAIRLDGHAAAMHGPQVLLLAIAMWAALGGAAWRLRTRPRWCLAFGLLALVYPAFAFTGGRELLHLLGGHLGELAIAGVFFWRGLSGGFTHSRLERALYALMAWFLLIQNLKLTVGLMFSDAARAHYHGNGSFGLTNDYIRVAGGVLGWPLETVAAGMTLVALAVLPAAVIGWLSCRRTG